MAVEKLIVDHIDTWTTAQQTRSTAGRGSSGKIDLYGIKKLRELILELAVRGKLVLGSERRTGVGTSGAYCGGKGQADEAREN